MDNGHIYVCIWTYIYIYTYAHTHTHTQEDPARTAELMWTMDTRCRDNMVDAIEFCRYHTPRVHRLAGRGGSNSPRVGALTSSSSSSFTLKR